MISTIHSNKIFPVLTFITVDQSFCLPCWLDFEVGHNLQLQHVEVPRPAGNFLWAHRQTMRTLQKELENSGFTWQRSVFFGHRFKIWVIIPGIQTTSAIKAAKIGYEHLISMASKNLRLRNLRNEVICLAKPFGCFKRHLACGLNICLFSSQFGKMIQFD